MTDAEPAAPTLTRTNDSGLSRIYVYQGALTNPSWCGVTNYNTSGSTINYANIGIAQKAFGTSGTTGTTCDSIDTVIREFGQAQGLAHSQVSNAIMYQRISQARSMHSPLTT